MKRVLGAALAFCLASSPVLANAPVRTQEVPAEQAERPVLDVVFVLDTTSSMSGLIEGAKQKIWSIASRMASGKPTPRVRVGLVAYRDQGDAYVTQVHGLSDDLDGVYKKLMTFQAEGGGDAPEAVQTGLADAVHKMQWSDSRRAAKMIFVVGDQPAHEQDRAAMNQTAKQAIAKGIVVNTIRCGADATAGAQFQELARLADGRFDSIDQSGGVLAVATPFDAELAKLNAELMDTALYAGRAEARAEGETRAAEAKAMAPAAAADRVSYLSKSGGGAGLGRGSYGGVDLTAAPEQAAKMKKEELPPAMQKLSAEERVAFAKAQQAKRGDLQTRIAEVAKKRDAYVATKSAEKTDSFDARVFESVKTAAKKAGVAY